MKRSSKVGVNNNTFNGEIDWEVRPGGMIVQKRYAGDSTSGPVITIKVSHGFNHHVVSVPAQFTFGELKSVLAHETGLAPREQRLLFRGKEKDDEEYLHMVGVNDMSKVILLEDPASKERKLEEMKRNQGIIMAYEAVIKVRSEVDKLSEKVVALDTAVHGGTKVADREFHVLTELLMTQLLKLDAIEAVGEAKVQRRVEVRRVQSFVDTLDDLKSRISNPSRSSINSAFVTTNGQTFKSGVGSLSAPSLRQPSTKNNPGVGSLSAPSLRQSSTKITQDWEHFD